MVNKLRAKISGKIQDYRRRDKLLAEKYYIKNIGLTTINSDEGIKLIEKYGKICPGCKCKMKLKNYKPWCLYQFTFDKIDNEKIHCFDNLKLACYNCNCLGYGKRKSDCVKSCHLGYSRNYKIRKYQLIIESYKFWHEYKKIFLRRSKNKQNKKYVLL